MEISEKGIKLIKKLEGFGKDNDGNPYKDQAGVWTIGYGSTYYLDGTQVKQKDPIISEPDADLLLRHTIGNYQLAIDPLFIVNLNPNQYDAIMCFVYNLGPGAFRGSTLLKRINADPKDERIKYEFSRWNKVKNPKTGKFFPSDGLTARRKREADLYFS